MVWMPGAVGVFSSSVKYTPLPSLTEPKARLLEPDASAMTLPSALSAAPPTPPRLPSKFAGSPS